MSQGLLRKCFKGVAAKRLSAVEADPQTSNQHEFNGVSGLKDILGTEEPKTFPATFVWLGNEQDGITEEGFLTWYDARRNHPTRSEYRLYYPSNAVSRMATAGDPVFIATRPDGTIMVITTKAESTLERQLLWLFELPDLPGLTEEGTKPFNIKKIETATEQADFAVRYILDELGLEPEEPETDHLDSLLEKFGAKFPTTSEFSLFARNTLTDVSPLDNPDNALLLWLNQEEILFRRLERHIVADRLRKGFCDDSGADIDGFISFSLSVQNRRKSRIGQAFENHLEEIFKQTGLKFKRGGKTEGRRKPDFLFPGENEYHNLSFPDSKLTMLGAKSTCKDRWRQVLDEAARIRDKHLITLEPGISEHQTDEMKDSNIQLIIPAGLYETYKPDQQSWLMNLSEFIELVKNREKT